MLLPKSRKVGAIFFRGLLLAPCQQLFQDYPTLDILTAINNAISRTLATAINMGFPSKMSAILARPHAKPGRDEGFMSKSSSADARTQVKSATTATTSKAHEDESAAGIPDSPPTATVSISAAERVFAIPEILTKILTNLDPVPLRNAMRVNSRFYDAVAPEASSRQMRVALGVEHRRKAAELTPEEVEGFNMSFRVDYSRPSRYLNVNIGEDKSPRQVPVPCLLIKPFVRSGLSYDPLGSSVTMHLTLSASSISRSAAVIHGRGIVRSNFHGMGMVHFFNPGCETWGAMKILKDAICVQIIVTVDYRQAMQQPTHPFGQCAIPFCQIARYGQQRVSDTPSLPPYAYIVLTNSFPLDHEGLRTQPRDSRKLRAIPRRSGTGSQPGRACHGRTCSRAPSFGIETGALGRYVTKSLS